MEKYSEKMKCKKCGSEDYSTRYDALFDRIEVVCNRCRHSWNVKPLDYEDEDETEEPSCSVHETAIKELKRVIKYLEEPGTEIRNYSVDIEYGRDKPDFPRTIEWKSNGEKGISINMELFNKEWKSR